MSGIRQFTPEDGQYSLLRPAAASKPSKYRNLYGLSPLTASFGVLPLETSPSEGYVISPSGTIMESSDQKVIVKRSMLGECYKCRFWSKYFYIKPIEAFVVPNPGAYVERSPWIGLLSYCAAL